MIARLRRFLGQTLIGGRVAGSVVRLEPFESRCMLSGSTLVKGDFDLSGAVDAGDIDAFVQALQYPNDYRATHPSLSAEDIVYLGDFGGLPDRFGYSDLASGLLRPDGVFDGADIDAFCLFLSNSELYEALQQPTAKGDFNRDGGFDVSDVDAFVAAVSDPDGYLLANPDLNNYDVLVMGDFGGSADGQGSFNRPDGVLDGFDLESFATALASPEAYSSLQGSPQPPDAPLDFRIVEGQPLGVALVWGLPPSSVTLYVVERNDDGALEAWSTVGIAFGTAFTDSSVQAGHAYSYRVRSQKGGILSAPSASVGVLVTGPVVSVAAQSSPSGVVKVNVGGTEYVDPTRFSQSPVNANDVTLDLAGWGPIEGALSSNSVVVPAVNRSSSYGGLSLSVAPQDVPAQDTFFESSDSEIRLNVKGPPNIHIPSLRTFASANVKDYHRVSANNKGDATFVAELSTLTSTSIEGVSPSASSSVDFTFTTDVASNLDIVFSAFWSRLGWQDPLLEEDVQPLDLFAQTMPYLIVQGPGVDLKYVLTSAGTKEVQNGNFYLDRSNGSSILLSADAIYSISVGVSSSASILMPLIPDTRSQISGAKVSLFAYVYPIGS